MGEFHIHPRLINDCHRLGRLPSSHLLLHRNSSLTWFILVPETDATDLLDLDRDLRVALMDDAATVSRFLKKDLGYPKVNFGAIGNLVPQMHLHVIGRRPGDSCWPAPVWGHLGDAPGYHDGRVAELVRGLAAACRLEPGSAEEG
jgi:diadenosine tetraphosphate (Ap4A) HIT family hydrolase